MKRNPVKHFIYYFQSQKEEIARPTDFRF